MAERPSFYSIVADVMASCPNPHPRVVADAVIVALPKSRYEEALRESLWLYVRQVSSASHTNPDSSHAVPAGGRPHSETSAGAGRMGAAVSLAWLRKSVSVSEGVYKFLGDCTADDLDVLAEVRRAHAKSNAEAADRYERLASLMREARAATLGALPVDVLAAES